MANDKIKLCVNESINLVFLPLHIAATIIDGTICGVINGTVNAAKTIKTEIKNMKTVYQAIK